MKNKVKQIYNIIFAVISLLPVIWAVCYFIKCYHEMVTFPDTKYVAYLIIPIACVVLMSAYTTLLFLYSGLKYFLFAPEKKPLKIIWNVTKLIFAVVAFLPIVDIYIYPIYWTIKAALR